MYEELWGGPGQLEERRWGQGGLTAPKSSDDEIIVTPVSTEENCEGILLVRDLGESIGGGQEGRGRPVAGCSPSHSLTPTHSPFYSYRSAYLEAAKSRTKQSQLRSNPIPES